MGCCTTGIFALRTNARGKKNLHLFAGLEIKGGEPPLPNKTNKKLFLCLCSSFV